jgi:molybdate transport system substrate-binding protein
MRPVKSLIASLALAAAALLTSHANAAQTHVAVAANFTDASKEIAAAFQKKTGHEAVLSFGSSGQFLTQITQDAPFEIFLSADDERPKKLVSQGFGVPGSEFTYAVGKLVLWSKQADTVKGEETLKDAKFLEAFDLRSGRRTLWSCGRRDDEVAQALRCLEAEIRPGC